MFHLFVRRRHGAFGRILVLPLRLAVAVVVIVIGVVVIIIVARAVVVVVLIVVETPLLVVVIVVWALLVVVLAVVVTRTLLLWWTVTALRLRPLEVGGRLLFTKRFQLDGVSVIEFVFIDGGIVFRLFLTGFRTDLLIDFGFELKAAFQSAAATGDVLRI